MFLLVGFRAYQTAQKKVELSLLHKTLLEMEEKRLFIYKESVENEEVKRKIKK